MAATDSQGNSDTFALVGPNAPVWRRIVKLNGSPEDGFTYEVVQDYTLDKAALEALQQVWLETADADDTPAQQQLLMTAWQAMATYVGSCDDEDKGGALIALKVLSNLMAGGEMDGPLPTETFGVTQQVAAAEFNCPKCKRNFATEAGLINHLKTIHKQQEKTPFKKGAASNNPQD